MIGATTPLPPPLAERLALLADWAAHGWLREVDHALAAFLAHEAPDADPLLLLGAALASHQLGRGHVCLDLHATLADSRFALSLPPEGDPSLVGEGPALPATLLAGVDLARWQAALSHPLLTDRGATAGGGTAPLVLDGPRLYLRRYWQYEQDVRAGIAARLAQPVALAPEALRPALDALFPSRAGLPRNDQKIACALMARSGFGIVTGGPGTGKTTTVVRLLALLQHLARQQGGRPLRIRLAAPTGKAAARLSESIGRSRAGLQLAALTEGDAQQAERLRADIPAKVTTLHRLLGSRPDTRRFRHDAADPLALDLLVIDEASMVDLEMMAAVLAALPPAARLVLLGDKDQLSSVEAGALLGELCSRAQRAHWRPGTRDWLEAATGESVDPAWIDAEGTALDQAVAMLRHSHRFDAASGIGRLADAVNAGDVAALRTVLKARAGDVSQLALAPGDAAWRALVLDGAADHFSDSAADDTQPGLFDAPAEPGDAPVGYRHYLQLMVQQRPDDNAPQAAWDAWARAVLAAHGRFQLLCALRRGDWGVEGLNRRVADVLQSAGLIAATGGWYAGRPVLVTRNEYGLGLMNGDVGIALAVPLPESAGSAGAAAGDAAPGRRALRVAFPMQGEDGAAGVRWVLPSRLSSVETVYAMTVHKSQGSEFAHAALVLPERLSPLLTRELVYTGITRARDWLTVASPGAGARVLEAAIQRRVVRASGLLGGTARA